MTPMGNIKQCTADSTEAQHTLLWNSSYLIISFYLIYFLQSYLIFLSYQVTWFCSSTVLCHSAYQSSNSLLVHVFHTYIINPQSASCFTHVFLLVYIVSLVAYLYLSLILLESPPTSVSPPGHIVNFPRCNEHADDKNAFWLMVLVDGLIGGWPS